MSCLCELTQIRYSDDIEGDLLRLKGAINRLKNRVENDNLDGFDWLEAVESIADFYHAKQTRPEIEYKPVERAIKLYKRYAK